MFMFRIRSNFYEILHVFVGYRAVAFVDSNKSNSRKRFLMSSFESFLQIVNRVPGFCLTDPSIDIFSLRSDYPTLTANPFD